MLDEGWAAGDTKASTSEKEEGLMAKRRSEGDDERGRAKEKNPRARTDCWATTL